MLVKVDPEFEQNNTIKIEGTLCFGYKTQVVGTMTSSYSLQ